MLTMMEPDEGRAELKRKRDKVVKRVAHHSPIAVAWTRGAQTLVPHPRMALPRGVDRVGEDIRVSEGLWRLTILRRPWLLT